MQKAILAQLADDSTNIVPPCTIIRRTSVEKRKNSPAILTIACTAPTGKGVLSIT